MKLRIVAAFQTMKRLLLLLFLPLILPAQTQPPPYLQQSFDTFTRANAATLGTNWFNLGTSSSMQIASNTAQPAATGLVETSTFVGTTGTVYPTDQCAEATFPARANNNTYGSVGVRMITNATSTGSGQGQGYFWGAVNGSGTAEIWRLAGGGHFQLQTGSAFATGVPYRLCVQGQLPPFGTGIVLTGYKNGVLDATFTDNGGSAASGAQLAISSGGYGLLLFATTTVGDIQATNWSGGTFVGAPTIVNSSGQTVTQVAAFTNTYLGRIGAAGQAVQFALSSNINNRPVSILQLIVGPSDAPTRNSVNNSRWTLVGSQDNGQSWFNVPAIIYPTGSIMGGQPGTIYGSEYNITGLAGNTIFCFILVSGTVNGSLPVVVNFG